MSKSTFLVLGSLRHRKRRELRALWIRFTHAMLGPKRVTGEETLCEFHFSSRCYGPKSSVSRSSSNSMWLSPGEPVLCVMGVILQSTLEPISSPLQGSHASIKYPVSILPGLAAQVPQAWLHIGIQVWGSYSKPPMQSLLYFPISTVVFLQNSKESSQRSSFEHLQRFQSEIIWVEWFYHWNFQSVFSFSFLFLLSWVTWAEQFPLS